jgi:hypothetical protein
MTKIPALVAVGAVAALALPLSACGDRDDQAPAAADATAGAATTPPMAPDAGAMPPGSDAMSGTAGAGAPGMAAPAQENMGPDGRPLPNGGTSGADVPGDATGGAVPTGASNPGPRAPGG